MAATFLFYDLETSGLNPRTDRIMQFAAQRTDLDLNSVGEPVNLFVRLDEDILPSPAAVLIHGTTPQYTHHHGISEKELLRFIHSHLFTPDTIAVGFNNIKFDDEFIRYASWRNFYDPYEWAWKDGRSRWDVLNVVRFTRALRPEGINWPSDDQGLPVNKLEQLTAANGITHDRAHDGLSDIIATIDIARLIKQRQPKLFDYLLNLRHKTQVASIITTAQPKPFIFTTSRYGGTTDFTSVAIIIGSGASAQEYITFNLRHDPTPWLSLSAEAIAKARFTKTEDLVNHSLTPFPFTRLFINKCPAIAPISVLDGQQGWAKLNLDPSQIQKHLDILLHNPHLIDNALEVYQAARSTEPTLDPETQLYDGFVNDADKRALAGVRNADPVRLATWNPLFHDERLPLLLTHYKARNYPDMLTLEEQTYWQEYRALKLAATAPKFLEILNEHKNEASQQQLVLIQALQKWYDHIIEPDNSTNSGTSMATPSLEPTNPVKVS